MLNIIGFAVVIGSGNVGLDACTASGAGHSRCSWDARRRRHGRTRPHLNRRRGRDAYVEESAAKRPIDASCGRGGRSGNEKRYDSIGSDSARRCADEQRGRSPSQSR